MYIVLLKEIHSDTFTLMCTKVDRNKHIYVYIYVYLFIYAQIKQQLCSYEKKKAPKLVHLNNYLSRLNLKQVQMLVCTDKCIHLHTE